MNNYFCKFMDDESGAVSADWVVMTAAMVTFALAVATLVKDNATTASTDLGETVATMEF